jgi:hypothetical protein
MCASHGLEVCLGVPVRIEDDDRICCHQIDPKTTSSRREKKAEVVAIVGIKVVDSHATRTRGDGAIKALKLVTTEL